MYDGLNSRLLADYDIIEAKTAKEAVMKLIKIKGYNIKNVKRSAGNDVRFRAEPFYEKNEQKYKNGNVVWYAPVNLTKPPKSAI